MIKLQRFLLVAISIVGLTNLYGSTKSEKVQNTYNLPDGLYAEMDTTKGTIILSLEFEKTPLTVTNFVALAEGTMTNATRKGNYYDGLTFHRVIANFMIQGGDPLGTGTGGPGYKFADEFDPTLVFDKPGILAMANSGPGTNGSQLFITHVPTPHLNGKHSIFGHVVQGQNVVNKIAQGDKINNLTIIRVGDNAKNFVANQETFNQLQATAEKRAIEKQAKANASTIAAIKKAMPNAKISPNGMYYTIDKRGNGKKPKVGDNVSVHYTGEFMDGTVFDSSIQRGTPIDLPVGAGKVIEGWDLSLLDMTKGEKRTVFIPPNLAYGERGYPGAIPPNSWIKFEMELIDIK